MLQVQNFNSPFYFHMKDHLRLGNRHILLLFHCSNTISCIYQLNCFCCSNARKQETRENVIWQHSIKIFVVCLCGGNCFLFLVGFFGFGGVFFGGGVRGLGWWLVGFVFISTSCYILEHVRKYLGFFYMLMLCFTVGLCPLTRFCDINTIVQQGKTGSLFNICFIKGMKYS